VEVEMEVESFPIVQTTGLIFGLCGLEPVGPVMHDALRYQSTSSDKSEQRSL